VTESDRKKQKIIDLIKEINQPAPKKRPRKPRTPPAATSQPASSLVIHGSQNIVATHGSVVHVHPKTTHTPLYKGMYASLTPWPKDPAPYDD
jgi:hypothetical protein